MALSVRIKLSPYGHSFVLEPRKGHAVKEIRAGAFKANHPNIWSDGTYMMAL
jgi:hypothetical protein